MTSKFIGFFRFVEACAQPGCPVCRCLREDGFSHLGALMYEQVNNPQMRETLRASWGFCNWHAWMLKEVPNSDLGAAIIYEDLLGTVLTRLRRLLVKIDRGTLNGRGPLRLFKRRPRIGILEARRRKAGCLICQSGRANEETYLRTILDFSGDLDFDRAFGRSQGVCVPHILHLIEIGHSHPRLEPVLRKIEGKWRQLQDQLKRFVGKHDYRATEKITEEEARSWGQVVETLAGAPGLFGNDFHAPLPVVSSASPATPDRPPEPAAIEQEMEVLRFAKAKLELRVKEMTDQFSEVSSRAAALHYRLWQVLEDRKVLEMNLSGAEASSRLLEQTVEELRKELDRLRAQAEAASTRPHA